MTTGPEWKEILLFSLPIMAGQFLQQLYNTVDGVVVGRYGGATQAICENMIAAVGSCVSLIFLFLAISIGLGNGGAVLVAQLYGARRTHELRRAASTLLITLVGLGTFLTVAGSVFAKPLVVGLMRVRDPDIVDMAIEYFAIYSLGLIFQYVYNAVAGILRAIGDSRATMYFLIVSAVLNTILDVWFVVSFGWGVVGVAVATVIAQAASAAVSVAYMFIKYPIFRFKKGEFVFDREKFAISLKLVTILQNCGYQVIMTRSTDVEVGLYERADLANAAGADVFVSIHANAAENRPDYQGIYTYYHPSSNRGARLAQAIQTPLCQITGAVDRGIKDADFVVLRETEMCAVLVETGFMTNHEELMNLNEDSYQQLVAQGIARGIIDYLNAEAQTAA